MNWYKKAQEEDLEEIRMPLGQIPTKAKLFFSFPLAQETTEVPVYMDHIRKYNKFNSDPKRSNDYVFTFGNDESEIKFEMTLADFEIKLRNSAPFVKKSDDPFDYDIQLQSYCTLVNTKDIIKDINKMAKDINDEYQYLETMEQVEPEDIEF